MRRQAWVIFLLVTASYAAIAVEAQFPARDEPTTLKESKCYDCHAGGSSQLGPPLQVAFLANGPKALTITPGTPVTLEIGIENGWVAEVQDIVAQADLSETQCLGFFSDRPDLIDEVDGIVTSTAGATNEQRSREIVSVQPGTSDLTISMRPTGDAPPDGMELRIWTPGTDPDQSPHNFNQGSFEDGAYTWSIHGASDIAALGIGDWTVDVVMPPATTGSITSAVDQPYQFSSIQEFKVSGASSQLTGSAEVLASRVEEPFRQTFLTWGLQATCVPTEPSRILIDTEAVIHYRHESRASSQYDDWRLNSTLVLEVIPASDGLQIQSTVIVPPSLETGFEWGVLSEIVGYLGAVLILASIYTGGMFGKASRRQLNSVFGNAKRRVAFHNFISYGIILAAIIHTIIFLVEPGFEWTRGIIWGGVSILAMFGLGMTGAVQVPMIRKWNYAVWRWSHFYMAIGTIAFTVIHILLDGVHFTGVQEAVGWANPLE